jgi:integrase/recombinase XerC
MDLHSALDAFERYLVAERARSEHTVRACRADLDHLLGYAQAQGVSELSGLTLGLLRSWLGA